MFLVNVWDVFYLLIQNGLLPIYTYIYIYVDSFENRKKNRIFTVLSSTERNVSSEKPCSGRTSGTFSYMSWKTLPQVIVTSYRH